MPKQLLKYTVIAAVLIGLYQCSSRKWVKDPPFALGEVVFENMTIKGSDSIVTLYIPVEEGKTVLLDSVYFRKQALKLEKIQRDSYLVYRARYTLFPKPDMILHTDSQQEFGNKPPALGKKWIGVLQDNEAVVRYLWKGKIQYFKIENIKESVSVPKV